VVLGVYYTPPGSASSVTYTNNTLTSSTLTTQASLSSSYTESETLLLTTSLLGWVGGSSTSGATTSYTQATSSSNTTSVALATSTSYSVAVPGPDCDYCGVDHDYDVIAVWLNPVQLYTLTSTGVQPNGYGYSTLDTPGMDIQYVYAGELNGDITMRSSIATAFERSWASVLYCGGTGTCSSPGLTSTDEANILAFDPYGTCTYESATTDQTDCPEPPSDSRYTESTIEPFPYEQPAPGGDPITTGYTWSYSSSDSESSSYTTTDSQTFGLESVFNGKIFWLGISATLQQSWTETQTYVSSAQYTSSNTSTASASITGPKCDDDKGKCSPVYPPKKAYDPVTGCKALSSSTAFGQGTELYLYQDNLFGTFLMEPYDQ
jgi:hypothetical protein